MKAIWNDKVIAESDDTIVIGSTYICGHVKPTAIEPMAINS